ncbi:hypothetical protein L207DRAFT_590441 [Hyaloscypha variabilis F]|uniref:Uncharacterized protein n=1 Tax=Hyaloscypha variabilis (strain UAMH 11265 / GT02V1 / F) TaxID=1149755 RepID=A0A2J6R2J5_HYAVF|nr:hypothetical protein L207DRAFT_590441 [Hyaloscypha variabilis F]
MKIFTAFVAVLPLATTLYISEEVKRDTTLLSAVPPHSCKITIGADVNCHYCDELNCTVVTVLQANKYYNFDCACPNGESINGIRQDLFSFIIICTVTNISFSAWDHNSDSYCWVWANATDYNCPTVGSNALPECAFCSK